MGKEQALPIQEGIHLDDGLIAAIEAYREKFPQNNFTPRDLLKVLVRSYGELFTGSGFEMKELKKSLNDSGIASQTRRVHRLSAGKSTPWTDEIFAHAQLLAGEGSISAPHLVLGILQHDISNACNTLRSLGDVNKLAANMQQRLASQAA